MPGTTGGDTPRASGESTLIVDASVAEQRIRYPSDVSLVNEARESVEALIDAVWDQLKAHDVAPARKPRSYRQRARRDYLAYSKQRRRSGRAHRSARRVQLQYLYRGNPPDKQRRSKVEYSRNLTRGNSREDIPIYGQSDSGDPETG